MSDNSNNIKDLIRDLGFSIEETDIYLYLDSMGERSALDISRSLDIPRTSVYRYLENLQGRGIVEEILDGKTKNFRSASPENFMLLLKEKEESLNREKDRVNKIVTGLQKPINSVAAKSEVLHYKGVEGLKQLTWNSLRAADTLRIYEIADMNIFMDYGFAEKVRQEFVNRGVRIHEMTNAAKMGPWTNVQRLYREFWTCRYLSPEIMHISSEILIYNDVYAMYGYKDNDVWGIEIYNEDLAEMQKQIFDSYWRIGREMKIGVGGSAGIN